MARSSTSSPIPNSAPISANCTTILASEFLTSCMKRPRRNTTMKSLISLTALTVALGCSTAQAQYTDGTIKIGVMNDMSGTYSDLSGQGSVIAARMAVED